MTNGMTTSASHACAIALAVAALAACSSTTAPSPPVDAGPDTADTDATSADGGADVLEEDATTLPADGGALASATVLDLADVKTNPGAYTWFDFRPNVKKLILAGAAETEHIAILWYTTPDGGVGLHYHAKTESVYVIDGTQTDAKGMYPPGVVYFNPPGSGHQITDSTGFFLLAYSAPPDFMSTNLIGEYTPLRLDTKSTELVTTHPFETSKEGVRVFTPGLDASGGLTAAFIELAPSASHVYRGNYLLVLAGTCDIEGTRLTPGWLVVGKSLAPQSYELTTAAGNTCLAMGLSF